MPRQSATGFQVLFLAWLGRQARADLGELEGEAGEREARDTERLGGLGELGSVAARAPVQFRDSDACL
jgi:hypothetical protein